MITTAEKRLIHIYAQAAQLSQPTYRSLLEAQTGKLSSADPDFTHHDADNVLICLETLLFQRVDAGQIPDPVAAGNRWIRDRHHFRRRAQGPGRITTRQAHRIETLWAQLVPHLPPDQQTPAYLAAILAHATGKCDIGITALTKRHAACLITALQDRIAHAIKGAHT